MMPALLNSLSSAHTVGRIVFFPSSFVDTYSQLNCTLCRIKPPTLQPPHTKEKKKRRRKEEEEADKQKHRTLAGRKHAQS